MALIRKARPADHARIVEMVGHFIEGTSYRSVLKFKPKVVGELTAMVLERGVILVAEVDGQVVGMIAAVPLEELVAKTPMLDEMAWWVEPAYRNGSVGPRLLKALETFGRQRGLSLLKMVAPWGTDVGDYYARLGYAPLETSYVKRLR